MAEYEFFNNVKLLFKLVKNEKPELFKEGGEYPLLHLSNGAIQIRRGNNYYYHVYWGNIIGFEITSKGYDSARRLDASCEPLRRKEIEGLIEGMNDSLLRFCGHYFPESVLGKKHAANEGKEFFERMLGLLSRIVSERPELLDPELSGKYPGIKLALNCTLRQINKSTIEAVVAGSDSFTITATKNGRITCIQPNNPGKPLKGWEMEYRRGSIYFCISCYENFLNR